MKRPKKTAEDSKTPYMPSMTRIAHNIVDDLKYLPFAEGEIVSAGELKEFSYTSIIVQVFVKMLGCLVREICADS